MYKRDKSPEKRSRKEYADDDYNKSGYKWGLKRYEDDHLGTSNKDSKSFSPVNKEYTEKDYKSTKRYDDYHNQSSSKYDRKNNGSDDERRDAVTKRRKDEGVRLPRSYRSRSPIKEDVIRPPPLPRSYRSRSPIKDYKSKEYNEDYRSKVRADDYRDKDLSHQLYKSEYLPKDDQYPKRDVRPNTYASERFIKKYPADRRRYSPRYQEPNRDKLRPYSKPPKFLNPVPPPVVTRKSNYSSSYIKAITSKPESLFKSVSPKFKSRPYLGNSRYFNIKYRHNKTEQLSTSAPDKRTEDGGRRGDNGGGNDDYKGKKDRTSSDDNNDTEQQLVNKKKYLVDRLAEYERNKKHKLSDDGDDDDMDNNDVSTPKKMKTNQSVENIKEEKKIENKDEKSEIEEDNKEEEENVKEEEEEECEGHREDSRSPSPLFEGTNYNLNFPTSTQAHKTIPTLKNNFQSKTTGTNTTTVASKATSSSSSSKKQRQIESSSSKEKNNNDNKGSSEKGSRQKSDDDDDDDIYPPLKYPGYVSIPYVSDKYTFKPLFKRSAFKNRDDDDDDESNRGNKKLKFIKKEMETLKFTINNDTNKDDNSEQQQHKQQSQQELNEYDLRHKIYDRRSKRQSTESKTVQETKHEHSTNLEAIDIHNIDNSKQPIRRVVESKDSHSLVTTISNGPMESKRSVVITRQQLITS